MPKPTVGWYMQVAIGTLLFSCASLAAMGESPFDVVQDDPKLPRVLLIGDSISIGYTIPVRKALEGKANVHRIPVNGAYTTYGLANIREWLGDGKWDVIHFNWGIWDTHMLDSSGALLSDKDEEGIRKGKIRTTISQYQSNLNKLIDTMESTGARLIWASSTPVMQRIGERLEDIGRYNRAAAEVMKSRHVTIDDLHTFTKPHLSEMQGDDGCHFTPQAYESLGKQVAECILAALCSPHEQSATWNAEQTREQTIEGRNVLRFEHDCLEQWGYTQKARQYFYVVEPKLKGMGPLMVCLHSAGGNGETELPPNVKEVADAGDDFTGLVLNSGADADLWWGAREIEAHPDRYKQTLTPVENRVLATVEWVVRRYNIDRNRVYLRGISMGGSGTLGIGMAHGSVFAALRAGVPAGTNHAIYRLANSRALNNHAETMNDAPPVLVFFSQKDAWSKGMENWFDRLHRDKLPVVGAWGPWGHLNHYEMTNAAAYEFPWLSIRRDQAYPAFANTSSDDKYPGFESDAPDQDGQMNAYFRWAVLEDQAGRFAIELRLVQNRELGGSVDVPAEVISDVTLRRLQRFEVSAGEAYRWKIERAGRLVHAGLVRADNQSLITIPEVKVSAKPITLCISSE